MNILRVYIMGDNYDPRTNHQPTLITQFWMDFDSLDRLIVYWVISGNNRIDNQDRLIVYWVIIPSTNQGF